MKRFSSARFGQFTVLTLLLTSLVACNRDSTTPIKVSKPPSPSVQTVYYGGDIITMEGDKTSYVEVVIEQKGKISYAGSKANLPKEFKGKTLEVNLQGKTMLPGFIEPHVHPSIAAILLSGDVIAPHDWQLPNVMKKGAHDHETYIQRLQTSVKQNATNDHVLFVWGYHQLWHGDLNRQMLNKISPDKPIAVIHRSFHEVFLNDKALELMKIQKQDFINNKQVNWDKGHFYEGGWLALVPKISTELLAPERYKKGLGQMSKLIQKNGITTIAEQGFPSADFAMEYNLLLTEMDKKPPYDIYNVFNGTQLNQIEGSNEKAFNFISSAQQNYDTDNVTMLPKQVKLFADGAIYSLAMKMKEGYRDGFKGQWMTPLDTFTEQMTLYWNKGYKINIHANGDLGIQRCLDIVEKLMKDNPRVDHRLTLHHLGYFTDEQVETMQRLGIEASVNPYYLWALADKYSQYGLGKQRAENLVDIKLLQDRNIPYSFHSDFGMAPIEPLTLAWVAVNRMTSEKSLISQHQRIDVFHAIKAITLNAARTLNLETTIGSIKAGKIANFTLLAQNPFKVAPLAIKDIKVDAVIYRGQMHVNPPPLVGDDSDINGCKGSAGYRWCDASQQCQRPWLLAKEKGFENTAKAFDDYCKTDIH